MAGLGAPELLIVFAVIMLIFGSSKVPQLARSLGQARREFDAGQRNHTDPE
jgi:sec-independent protein translocase protein TatA